MKILITGAAGNLGALLARYLLDHSQEQLRLMIHRTDVCPELRENPRSEIVRADLADMRSLVAAVSGIEVIVHFAGVLFKSNPEDFLPVTNTKYFRNLVDAAISQGVKKIILISFPHVEGPTTFENPARGRLDGSPVSVHARTRLEEEKYLFEKVAAPVSLRVGMVYGRGILMPDAARWLSQRRLLGVWKEPTQIHLISKTDFCAATVGAILNVNAKGIYHLGDDGPITLQQFLDFACDVWGTKKPWRMPLWLIYSAADACEFFSKIFGTRSGLTRDFIDIGRVSYFGDTARMKQELLPKLKYPTMFDGKETL